ncbi:MAG: hypothetical protein L3J03_06105 [Desulfobacterales bacterium]|nr:hypothetical protein [Desulfobacterales bacterium]
MAQPTRPSSGNNTRPLAHTPFFTLNRLKAGVDNYRFDVFLSPDFIRDTATLIRTLLTQHLPVGNLPGPDSPGTTDQQMEAFARNYRQIILAALTRAKQQGDEVQIDLLAQLAVCKAVRREIPNQFADLTKAVNGLIWEYESSQRRDPGDAVELKETLASFRRQKKTILARITKKLFQTMFAVQQKELNKMRAALFGPEAMRPDDLLINPILLAEPDQITDDFLLDEYVLLGQRLDDPDHYPALLALLREIFQEAAGRDFPEATPADARPGPSPDSGDDRYDRWLKHPENIDFLFNPEPATGTEAATREQRLNLCLARFKQKKLLARVVATAEMKQLYREFCPPLAPQQVRQFLLEPSSRRSIAKQLERHRRFFGRTISLTPLQRLSSSLAKIDDKRKQRHLILYLKDFCRYHRDLTTSHRLRELMDRIHLVRDEKLCNLSRANATLYEFLLPHEQILDLEPGPVTRHVILKADIRGAMSITRRLLDNGLNPASYFSLNFFEPIARVVAAYDAEKLFIEGDAIILALSGHQDGPDDWFGVARACGLAFSIIKIIDKYNAHGTKHHLPPLEIGCGISFRNAPPAYLFDEERPIMISPAINRADRLSGNARDLGRLLADCRKNFNLYVFRAGKQKTKLAAVGKDAYWRYNVNGIELDRDGFMELSREINLQKIDCRLPDITGERHTLYTGTFPSFSGRFQRLVIREAEILTVHPETLKVVGTTGRKYYEICTLPRLYDFIRKIA